MSNLDSDPAGLIPQIILIVILTLINAFFASAEMAIVSVNKSKIRKLSEEGNKKAKLLEKLIEEPSSFLSTIQIGITLAGFFSSASAATGISTYINDFLSPFNIPYTKEISMVGVTLLLSYFTLVFGELVPKRVALKKAEKIALSSVNIINLISILAKPFIKILSFSTYLVLKLIRINHLDVDEKVSEEEIRTLITKSEQDGCIEDYEKKMLDGVFEFNDKTCKEIMTSSNDTFLINIDDDINIVLDEVISLGYSRIPIYEYNIDNIIGVLYVKDLLAESRKVGFDNIDIRKIMQEPYFVPENKKTNDLFKILKEKKIHLAFLVDEYGGFSGIVTMEDLIEEIVGDIDDEYDIEEINIYKISENTFIAKGILPISEVRERFNKNIINDNYDTLNGYLIANIGEVPKDRKEIILDNIKFEILKIGNRRIEEVKLTVLN